MALPDPPTLEPIAAPLDRFAGKNLPPLAVTKRWLDWLSEITRGVDQAPSRKAKLNLAAQSASLPVTPIPLSSIPAGIWRVSYVARVTTPATSSSSLAVTFSWTVGGVSQSQTAAAITGNAVTTVQFGTLPIRIDRNTPVSLSTTYASVGAQPMLYSIDVVVEILAPDGVA